MRTYFVYSCIACNINLEFFRNDRQAWIETRDTHKKECCVKIELRENTLYCLKADENKILASNPFFQSEVDQLPHFYENIAQNCHYIRLFTNQDRQRWNELLWRKHEEKMPQKLLLWEAMRQANTTLSSLQTTEGDTAVGDHEHHSCKPDPTVDDEAGAHVGEFRD